MRANGAPRCNANGGRASAMPWITRSLQLHALTIARPARHERTLGGVFTAAGPDRSWDGGDVSALSSLIEERRPGQRAATYDKLAEQALRVFDVTTQEVTFLGHNSGVAFRVETCDGRRRVSL